MLVLELAHSPLANTWQIPSGRATTVLSFTSHLTACAWRGKNGGAWRLLGAGACIESGQSPELALESHGALVQADTKMIEHALIHGLTKVLLEWLRGGRSGVVRPDPADQSINLCFGRAYRVTIALTFVIATGFLIGGVLVVGADRQAQAIMGVVFGALWLGAAYGLYDAFCVQVRAAMISAVVLSPMLGVAHGRGQPVRPPTVGMGFQSVGRRPCCTRPS